MHVLFDTPAVIAVFYKALILYVVERHLKEETCQSSKAEGGARREETDTENNKAEAGRNE